jgi:predicted DNA repair protein MutK
MRGMAASSLLALVDDIATVLDDVALLSKIAAKKTAGVLGDDLALNAQQVTGLAAERELPVVWAVAQGSLLNKAILVPAALAISVAVPWLITPLLMLGGAYLCFEGFEKIAHRLLHSREEDEAHRAELLQALQDTQVDLVALERDRIKGAIRTDFILSAEIITIALGTVADAPLLTKFLVLAGVAAAMTVGVYGFVAAIVKLDDLGLWMTRRHGAAVRTVGQGLVNAAPWLMKLLSVAGTAAMFFVGGGILVHGWPALHHAITAHVPGSVAFLAFLAEAGVGMAAGALVLVAVTAFQRLRAWFS